MNLSANTVTAGPSTGMLIAAAMRIETLAISRGARSLRVHRTGVGPKRARNAARVLLDDPAQALVVMGLCGGLKEHDRPGEVILASELYELRANGELERSCGCSVPNLLLDGLIQKGIPARAGCVVSSPKIVLGAERARLQSCGGEVVDMESAWLSRAANGRPLVVIRVIADTPRADLKQPGRLTHGWVKGLSVLGKAAGVLQQMALEHGTLKLCADTEESAAGL